LSDNEVRDLVETSARGACVLEEGLGIDVVKVGLDLQTVMSLERKPLSPALTWAARNAENAGLFLEDVSSSWGNVAVQKASETRPWKSSDE
jgi:hypothetical protein